VITTFADLRLFLACHQVIVDFASRCFWEVINDDRERPAHQRVIKVDFGCDQFLALTIDGLAFA